MKWFRSFARSAVLLGIMRFALDEFVSCEQVGETRAHSTQREGRVAHESHE